MIGPPCANCGFDVADHAMGDAYVRGTDGHLQRCKRYVAVEPEALEVDQLHGALRENAHLRAALERIAAPKRPDGTYNHSREACEQIARDALERPQ